MDDEKEEEEKEELNGDVHLHLFGLVCGRKILYSKFINNFYLFALNKHN